MLVSSQFHYCFAKKNRRRCFPHGGLAGSYVYRTERDRTNYIKEVYETNVTRDLVQKYHLSDTMVLQRRGTAWK